MVVTVAAHEVCLPLGEGDSMDILEPVDGLLHGAPLTPRTIKPYPVNCLGVAPIHCKVPLLGVFSSYYESCTIL